MTNVLMLASFGLEIVECGGALARAVRAGDRVSAAVLLSRPDSQPQVRAAAATLGIDDVEFLDFRYGEVDLSPQARMQVVELLRRVRPAVVVMQDPEHAQHDLDPDRRIIALLYAEAVALASRDWRIDECGGHEPLPLPTIYYMTPLAPNCVVEIGETFPLKQAALESLTLQLAFTAQAIRSRTDAATLETVAAGASAPEATDATIGLALHREFARAEALVHGMAGHSGAVLGEPYRREGPFLVDRLLP